MENLLDEDLQRIQSAGKIKVNISWANQDASYESIPRHQKVHDWLTDKCPGWVPASTSVQLGGFDLDFDSSWDTNGVLDGGTINVKWKQKIANVVLDVGSHTIKAGYSGDDAPARLVPPFVNGRVIDTDQWGCTTHKFVGDAALRTHGMGRAQPIVDAQGLYSKGGRRQLFQHIFQKELGVDVADESWHILGQDSEDDSDEWDEEEDLEQIGVIMTEKPLPDQETREGTTQMMFEDFNVNKFYLAGGSTTASYSAGRTNSIVVDLGHGGCTVVPIYEGFTMPHAIQFNRFSAEEFEDALLKAMLQDRYLEYHHSMAMQQCARHFKHTYCRVALDFDAERRAQQEKEHLIELPDGEIVNVRQLAIEAPEQYFRGHAGPGRNADLGLHELVHKCISILDIDIRRDLTHNIILVGGSSLLPNLGPRLQAEISPLCPEGLYRERFGSRCNVIASPERQMSAWIGCSIMGCLSTFQSMWIFKAQYDEQGPRIVHSTCHT